MAKNYTFAEAVQIIAEGKDMSAIAEIGKRFPLLLSKVTVCVTKAGNDFAELMSYMPEYLTANKVNDTIKNALLNGDDEDEGDKAAEANTADEDEPAEKTGKKAKKAAKKASKDDDDEEDDDEEDGGAGYESMTSKELWKLVTKRGLKSKTDGKKANMIKALKAADAASVDEDDDESAEDDAETDAYEGKSAMELFKECKSRGIKATPKKGAKYYIDLLKKDDAAKAEEADVDDDDDWDDDEPEEEAEPPKKNKKSDKKSNAKSKKKDEPEDEDNDDDDWDI